MINYFIKFDDLSLSTVRLFTYDEGSKKQVKKYSLIDAKEALMPGNNLYIMIPSALFGFKVTKNEIGLKDEILKANKYANEAQEAKKMSSPHNIGAVSYTHLRAHETGRNLVCRVVR